MLWPIGPVTTELPQGGARPVCRGDRQRQDCAPSCPLPTVRSRSSARSRSWSTRGPAFYIAKECDEPGVGEPEGPRPAVVNGGRDWQMSPSRFEVAYLQAPQTGPLYGHGMQSGGASADHSVSAPMSAKPAIQIVPVMTFRCG